MSKGVSVVLTTRRDLIRAGLGTAAGLAAYASPGLTARQGAAFAQAPVTSMALGDSLHIVTAGGVNAVARISGPETLLVDGGSTATSASLLSAVRDLPNAGPIGTLFNTHWHPEQTGSNLELGEAGATIIAQENTRLWLTTDIVYPWDENQHFDPLPEIARPNQSFYDSGALESGVRYGYLPHAAHTDGDLYVWFPDENVLAVGDAVSGDGWPFVDWWTGGWIGGIVGTLQLVISLMNESTRVVPARGPVLGFAGIQAQLEMYNTIYNRLSSMMNNGYGPDDAIADAPTAEFDAEMGDSEEFVRRSFESLWAYISPDA